MLALCLLNDNLHEDVTVLVAKHSDVVIDNVLKSTDHTTANQISQ